jgi:putative PIN family toxin of toxin-antitoxin system
LRVVFDTNTVVSALVFASAHLSWLRGHWRVDGGTPLVSQATVDELVRVLAYAKFELGRGEIEALLGDYLPFAEVIEVPDHPSAPRCRDPDDQMFVDLALQGNADVLVTGDAALLEMDIGVAIESPGDYKARRTSDH